MKNRSWTLNRKGPFGPSSGTFAGRTGPSLQRGTATVPVAGTPGTKSGGLVVTGSGGRRGLGLGHWPSTVGPSSTVAPSRAPTRRWPGSSCPRSRRSRTLPSCYTPRPGESPPAFFFDPGREGPWAWARAGAETEPRPETKASSKTSPKRNPSEESQLLGRKEEAAGRYPERLFG